MVACVAVSLVLLCVASAAVNILHGNRETCTRVSPSTCPEQVVPSMTRAEAALRYRIEAAYLENGVPPCHWSNGDEQLYATRINSFAKCLPMNDLGEPRIDAFEALVDALRNGTYEALEQLPLTGGRLKDPLAAHAHPLEGMDGGQGKINPAPAFSSAEAAGELVELYWLSLLRDVNFDQYATHPLAAQAVSDLSRLSDYRGPSLAGGPSHLFRGTVAGCLVGPYVSQFMWKNFSVWNMFVDPKLMQPPVPNQAFSTSWSDWMRMEQCLNHSFQVQLSAVPRYIQTARDLAHAVWDDVLYQYFFSTAMILTNMNAPSKSSLPYFSSRTQEGFATFGPAHIHTLAIEPAPRALKAAWFQKWLVHRRARPEVYAARLYNHLAGRARYPFHADLLNAAVLDLVNQTFGSVLLAQGYPDGSPTHPSYPAGHATVAGASVTILKAWFDEDYVIPHPVVPSADGTRLMPYVGPPLTVGGELNKLACNIAMGRNAAGIHFRSDMLEGMRLGEQLAISILRDQKGGYAEKVTWTFTSFDGDKVVV